MDRYCPWQPKRRLREPQGLIQLATPRIQHAPATTSSSACVFKRQARTSWMRSGAHLAPVEITVQQLAIQLTQLFQQAVSTPGPAVSGGAVSASCAWHHSLSMIGITAYVTFALPATQHAALPARHDSWSQRRQESSACGIWTLSCGSGSLPTTAAHARWLQQSVC